MERTVLLHGYNVNEVNWKSVVWGIPPDKPGRIPTSIAVMLEEAAENLILFGSSMGKERKGKWVSSGRWMRDLLFSRINKLKKFTILEAFNLPLWYIYSRICGTFELIEDLERPANTLEEIQAMSRIAKERDIQDIIAVSSPDHVSRIMRDAVATFIGTPMALHFSVRASATLYTEGDGSTPSERASMDNVVIAEPRMQVVPYFKRMFRINNSPEALAEIDAVLKRYGK